jgi:hypothetical protein
MGVRDIWLQKLGLKEDDVTGDFATRLWLVCGDQLTCSNIHAAQKYQACASQAYDRRKWMLTVAGLFHVRLNYTPDIVRTHWKPRTSIFFLLTMPITRTALVLHRRTQNSISLSHYDTTAGVCCLFSCALVRSPPASQAHSMGLSQEPCQGELDRQQTVRPKSK